MTLNSSLSAIIRAQDAQATIVPLVSRLLEVLPELTTRFDVVIVDDGSRDATVETAHELGLLYPQVHLVAHPSAWGPAAAMRSGLAHSAGHIVMYQDSARNLDATGLARLWRAIRVCDAAWTRYPSGTRDSKALGATAPEPIMGVQMIRRRPLEAWRDAAGEQDWIGFLIENGYRCHELAPVRQAAAAAEATWKGSAQLERTPRDRSLTAQTAEFSGARRPNYLERLKHFALGE